MANNVITFDKWYEGMAQYPLQGHGLLRNVDVLNNPGVVNLASRTELDFTPNNIIVAEVVTSGGDVYSLSNNGSSSVIYKNGVSLITGLGQGRDLLIYKGYLLYTHGSSIGAYGPVDSGSATNWDSLTGTSGAVDANYYAKMLYGQDDKVYIACGANIASLTFSASGTPGVEPTVSFSASALDLPAGHFAVTLSEIGKFLAIGTQTGGSWAGTSREGRIYTWDRVSASVRLPIIFNEDRVHQLYSHANRLYCVAGSKGNLYVTDSANFSRLTKIPFTTVANSSTLRCYPNAIDISQDGKLFIGTSTELDAFNGTTKHGVWEIDVMQSKAPSLLKHTISTGNTGASQVLKIGSVITQTQTSTRIAWQDGSSYGADITSSVPYQSYGGIIETQLVQVGTALNKRTFEHIEWTLSEPLQENQAVKISYRKNLFDSFTEIGDWVYSGGSGTQTDVGGVISFEDEALIADAEWVQLKIELDDTNSSSAKDINLIRVQLW